MNKIMKRFRKNHKGFTMVELIIVVAIIAVLAAVLAPQYLKYVEKSKIATDIDTARAIENAVSVLVADGTAKNGDTVTWNATAGGIAVTGTVTEANVTDITGTPPKGKSEKAADVTFTVEVTADAASVKANPDYNAWDD